MPWFEHGSDEHKAFDTVNDEGSHKAHLTHELLAAAASYEAAKAYEQHVAKNGKPPTHEKAKEIIAALSGAFIDRIVETKGLDAIDKHKAKKDAEERTKAKLAASGDY